MNERPIYHPVLRSEVKTIHHEGIDPKIYVFLSKNKAIGIPKPELPTFGVLI